jgi:hypothetical protein
MNYITADFLAPFFALLLESPAAPSPWKPSFALIDIPKCSLGARVDHFVCVKVSELLSQAALPSRVVFVVL